MPKPPISKVKQFQKEYFKTISTMALSGFSLVAALAWNELIKAIIDRYIPKGSSVVSHLFYAIIVTTLVVMVTIYLGNITKKFDERE